MVWSFGCECGRSTYGFQVALLFFNLGSLLAVKITSVGDQTTQLAIGDSTQLNCTYTIDATNVGSLDIEWWTINPDSTDKDTVVLAYMEKQVYQYLPPQLMGRFKFVASDPSNGDASVFLSDIRSSDTGTYQCKVKKTPGIDTRKIILAVLEKPSKLACRTEGTQEEGNDVILQCKSEGSAPITYTWERIGDQNSALPASAVPGPGIGDLTIKNNTHANAGTYRCIAKNSVGQGECIVVLAAGKAGSRIGMIIGAVIGALLLLLLLLLLLWLLICCCNKRRYQKEVANEIREDTAAPVSRTNSQASSLISILGYRPHQVNYSMRRKYKAANQGELSDPTSPVSSIHSAWGAGTNNPSKSAGVTFAPTSSSHRDITRGTSNASSVPSSKAGGYNMNRMGGFSLREPGRPIGNDINRMPSNASAPAGKYIVTNRGEVPFTVPTRSNALEDISRIPSNASDLRFGKITDNNISRMGGVPVMAPAQAREGYVV